MARKFKIENSRKAHSAIPRGEPRAPSIARRQPLTIAQTLRIGSRPNLAQLPSRTKR
jgi:hypothetical protein